VTQTINRYRGERHPRTQIAIFKTRFSNFRDTILSFLADYDISNRIGCRMPVKIKTEDLFDYSPEVPF